MPAVEVTLAVAPPPPPPPPPPKKRASSKPKTKPTPPKPTAIVAPKETPKSEPEPEPEGDSGEDEDDSGEEGGEEGGVEGGVIGGVVGSTAPPPPPKQKGPALLTNKAGHKLLTINPLKPPYKANVPERYVRMGSEHVAQVQVCVSAQGRVSSVKILRPTIPPIDNELLKVIPKWRYRPHVVNGQPTPFCYPVIYRIN